MNTARISPAAAVVFDVPSDEDTVMGARVYVAGGKSTDGHRFSSVESYDPPNDEWFECAPMKEPRSDAMAFSQGSRFYVVGGENGDAYAEDDGILRTVEVYDEDLGSPHFEYGPPMPSPRCAAAIGLIDGKFYVAGGRGPQFEMLTSTVVFDVETQEWSHLAEMPEPVEHGASAVVDGKLYVAGGFSPEFSDEIFIYDPATDTWEKSKHVMRGACHTVAGTSANGQLVLTGGYDAHGIRNLVEVYDVRRNKWDSPFPPLRFRVGSHASVTIRLHDLSLVRAANGTRILNAAKQEALDKAMHYKNSLVDRVQLRASTAPARLPGRKELKAERKELKRREKAAKEARRARRKAGFRE